MATNLLVIYTQLGCSVTSISFTDKKVFCLAVIMTPSWERFVAKKDTTLAICIWVWVRPVRIVVLKNKNVSLFEPLKTYL